MNENHPTTASTRPPLLLPPRPRDTLPALRASPSAASRISARTASAACTPKAAAARALPSSTWSQSSAGTPPLADSPR